MSTETAIRARLSGRRCLVTGATGYLGRRLIPRLLTAGVRVTAQVRRAEQVAWEGVESSCGDLTDPEWAEVTRREWRWDDVVHLAGTVPGAARRFAEDAHAARAHVQLALGLARAIPGSWAGRLVHASSMTVYGAAPSLPVNERQPLAPTFLYAFAKVLSEDVWRASPHADCCLLRLPGLFSAARPSGALFHFTRAALAGRPIEITAAEPTLWDVLHVDDAAEAIVRVLGSVLPLKGPMNVSYGDVVQLDRVARLISELTTGVDVVNHLGIAHPPFQLDISLAKERIAWPPCSLEQRIQELVSEMSQHGES